MTAFGGLSQVCVREAVALVVEGVVERLQSLGVLRRCRRRVPHRRHRRRAAAATGAAAAAAAVAGARRVAAVAAAKRGARAQRVLVGGVRRAKHARDVSAARQNVVPRLKSAKRRTTEAHATTNANASTPTAANHAAGDRRVPAQPCTTHDSCESKFTRRPELCRLERVGGNRACKCKAAARAHVASLATRRRRRALARRCRRRRCRFDGGGAFEERRLVLAIVDGEWPQRDRLPEPVRWS